MYGSNEFVDIAVCIPTYNCSDFLRRTLQSVTSQKPGPFRLKILVIDDGSSDAYVAVVKEFAGVALVDYKFNVGVCQNFNRCLLANDADFLHILHGDDYVADDFYHHMSKSILEFPNRGLYYSSCTIVDSYDSHNGELAQTVSISKESLNDSGLLYENFLRTPSVIVNNEAYRRVGCYDAAFPHLADWQMWIRCIEAMGGVSVAGAVAYYRVHAENDTSKLVLTGSNILERLAFKQWLLKKKFDLDSTRFDLITTDTALWQISSLIESRELSSAYLNYCVIRPVLRQLPFQNRLFFLNRFLKMIAKNVLRIVRR